MQRSSINKILSITTVISLLHFVDDAMRFIIGRHTEITFAIVMIGVIGFSLLLAVLSRNKRIKQFIGN